MQTAQDGREVAGGRAPEPGPEPEPRLLIAERESPAEPGCPPSPRRPDPVSLPPPHRTRLEMLAEVVGAARTAKHFTTTNNQVQQGDAMARMATSVPPRITHQ